MRIEPRAPNRAPHPCRASALRRWGGTPLRDALRQKHTSCASLLYSLGARLSISESDAAGELCELTRSGSLDMLTIMIKCGCPINSADYDQRTCLHLAASEGNLRIAEFLATHGADLNVKDRWGGTPLQDAVRNKHTEMAIMLHKHGAELGYDDVTASGELCELAGRWFKSTLYSV